jgi:hypothetical protein
MSDAAVAIPDRPRNYDDAKPYHLTRTGLVPNGLPVMRVWLLFVLSVFALTALPTLAKMADDTSDPLAGIQLVDDLCDEEIAVPHAAEVVFPCKRSEPPRVEVRLELPGHPREMHRPPARNAGS